MAEQFAEFEGVCGLIVRQPGRPQEVLANFLKMILSYQYGLDLVVVRDVVEASSTLMDRGDSIHCVFVIQNQEIAGRTTVSALSKQGRIPLFLLFPDKLVAAHQTLYGSTKNVFIGAWERSFSQSETSLKRIIDVAFKENAIEALLEGAARLPYHLLQQKVEQQVRNLDTLPTLPEIVLQIMKMVQDPDTTIQDLEQVLSSDPAIVWKLLEAMKSPLLAGVRRKGDWTLRDAIVRLGVRRVATIAQQIKLMNSFIKPEDSSFDLRRFWEHSVGTALVTDILYTQGHVQLSEKVDFNDYWIGSLLHDVGKLVLGFSFPNQFAEVLQEIEPGAGFGRDFRQAEAQLGHAGLHEDIGRILLLKVDAGPRVVGAVGAHHSGGDSPGGLTGLIHLSNNISKDFGMGYLAGEEGVYSAPVLEAMDFTEERLNTLKEDIRDDIAQEVSQLVAKCMPPDVRPSRRPRPAAAEPGGQSPASVEDGEGPTPGRAGVADRHVALVALLTQIRNRVLEDGAVTDDARHDLLVDVDAVRAQLDKRVPNKNAILMLLGPLAQRGAPGDLTARLVALVNETLD